MDTVNQLEYIALEIVTQKIVLNAHLVRYFQMNLRRRGRGWKSNYFDT